MRRATWLLLMTGLVLANGRLLGTADAEEKSKGKVISLDGLKSTTPADWKEEKPTSSMRLTQFKLPAAKEDKGDAELVIFRNAGGSVRDNVDRWKRQWSPPEGKKLNEVAKTTEIKIGDETATVFQIEGTYNPPPFNPTYKGKQQPNFKMVAIQFKGPENLYHLILTGPAKTIDQHKKAFDGWVQGFK